MSKENRYYLEKAKVETKGMMVLIDYVYNIEFLRNLWVYDNTTQNEKGQKMEEKLLDVYKRTDICVNMHMCVCTNVFTYNILMCI